MTVKCGTKKRDGGLCQNSAGHGTDHVGTGRCRFHDRGAKAKNKNAQKHGMYARVFSDADMQEARGMQGGLEDELAITRLQLFNLLNAQEENNQQGLLLEEISERTIAHENVVNESQLFERKRISKRRDFTNELCRLVSLIAKLEMMILDMELKQLAIDELKRRKEPKQGQDEFANMTDKELDDNIIKLFS
ncbi:hypothetical protein AYL20_16200 [Acinetobacter venetianus]|uniref:hypothetical protein n=1 Tax=Acinetobacter venetianus TaxID=52133 RepID=UPI0007756212|nr:hypothetical protein [Acinetobacter venetianus]KXO81222.1 hypothetical protein AYL20_16200 [Acinetobacter venetianus]